MCKNQQVSGKIGRKPAPCATGIVSLSAQGTGYIMDKNPEW
jgi:hypothetical protein